MLTLADIIEAITQVRPSGAGGALRTAQVITEATVDSRQVIPGSLFVALPGERLDGHDFVGAAFEQGAQFAFVQRDMRGQFPVLDLRQANVETQNVTETQYLASLPAEGPLCLWVDDTLAALQQTARFWRRKLNLRVIGITGSIGKSTTKELVAEVLSQR